MRTNDYARGNSYRDNAGSSHLARSRISQISVVVTLRRVDPLVHGGSKHPLATDGFSETVDRVDPDLGDCVGVFDGDLFDLNAAFLRQHAEMLLG